jgi:hypothetical protein
MIINRNSFEKQGLEMKGTDSRHYVNAYLKHDERKRKLQMLNKKMR